MPTFRPNNQYLGDGVYASFDGFQIWLQVERTNEQDQTVIEEIALEPDVLRNLWAYADNLRHAGEPKNYGTDKKPEPFAGGDRIE